MNDENKLRTELLRSLTGADHNQTEVLQALKLLKAFLSIRSEADRLKIIKLAEMLAAGSTH